jgi:hypothetical protein
MKLIHSCSKLIFADLPFFQILYWTHVALLLNSIFTLALCIALVVIGSKVICYCCGGGDQGDDQARQDPAVLPGGEYESQVPFLSID